MYPDRVRIYTYYTRVLLPETCCTGVAPNIGRFVGTTRSGDTFGARGAFLFGCCAHSAKPSSNRRIVWELFGELSEAAKLLSGYGAIRLSESLVEDNSN